MSAEPDRSAGTRPAGPAPAEVAPPRAGIVAGPPAETNGARNGHGADRSPAAAAGPNGAGPSGSTSHEAGAPGCTAAQLRRFIKSRAYVPMHELRRRFELNGEADDVSPVDTPQGLIYLGLPPRESRLIGELVRQGEIGVELCRDPRAPIAVGVYPMRPITRQ